MEASAAYALSFMLSPQNDTLESLARLILLSTDAEIFNISIQTLVGLYLMTCIFRFSAQVFFGHGFFDPLFGITTKSGFLASRVLGGFKVILETLLFPIVVFHVVYLNSSQTPIEKWSSFQKYQDMSPGPLGHIGVFLTPFAVILSLYSPLIMGLTIFDGVKVTSEKTGKLQKPDPSQFSSYELYSSKLYGFKTLSSLGYGRFILLPQFDLSRMEGRLKLSPHILIYDKREFVFLELKLKATLRMGALIERSQKGVPFWGANFPELSQAYSLMSEDLKKGQEAFVFKGQACSDLQRLVKSSFELSFQSLVDHTFDFGPFLRGFVELRRSLLSIVGPEIPPEVDFYELGDTSFLRFRQLYDLPQRQKAIEQTFLPMCVTKSPVFVLKSDSDMPSAISRNDFLAEFFSQSEWFFEDKGAVFNPLPIQKEEINVFHLLDYAQWGEVEEEDFEKLEEGISYFFFNLGFKVLSLSQQNEELNNKVESSMSRMLELLALNRKKDRTLITRGLIIYLEQTLEAFQNKNKSYFGIIKGSQREIWER
jgi:hypothetical protein